MRTPPSPVGSLHGPDSRCVSSRKGQGRRRRSVHQFQEDVDACQARSATLQGCLAHKKQRPSPRGLRARVLRALLSPLTPEPNTLNLHP